MRSPRSAPLLAVVAILVGVLAGVAVSAGRSVGSAVPGGADDVRTSEGTRGGPTTDGPSRGAGPSEPGAEPTAQPSEEPAACGGVPLERRAALVLVVGLPDVTDPDDPLVAEVTELGVGGVFLAGYNVATRDQVRALTAALRDGPDPPPLIATDEEWGRVSAFRDLLGATSSPRTLAATRTADEVRDAAADLGRELAALGVDWNLAPVADLDEGPADGVIGDRSFSADVDIATSYAGAVADGLSDGGIIPTIKHFPGHGPTLDADPHSAAAATDITAEQLARRDLRPFVTLIEDGAPVVMLGHVTYTAIDDVPASMSPAAYRLLRDTGFDGVAITDSIGMGAVHRRWDFPDAAVRAVRSGADAVLATDGNQARRMRDALVAAVDEGRLPTARLDEAVHRMLRLHGADVAAVCGGGQAAT